MSGVFRVKNRQKIIFLPITEGGAKSFGVFRVKNHDFTPKNHFCPILGGGGGGGGGAGCATWFRPCYTHVYAVTKGIIIKEMLEKTKEGAACHN
jgi:hypothetical protein